MTFSIKYTDFDKVFLKKLAKVLLTENKLKSMNISSNWKRTKNFFINLSKA